MNPEAEHPHESEHSHASQPTTTTTTPPATDGGPSASSRLQSAVAFARRHRRLTIASVAGVALLSEPELAVGVLLGAGTLALLTRRARRARAASQPAEQAQPGEQARPDQPEAQPGGAPGAPADEARSGRPLTRRAGALGHEVRERARAMAQAARGSLHATPPGGQEPASAASASDSH
jgi:hypothetical protein